MNFDHVNKVSDFDRTELFPYWSNKLSVADFGQYLARMAETKSGRWMAYELRIMPITYFIDPVKFSKKYAKKCITFTGTSNPQDGAFNVIYQISPTLHVLARLFQWVEQEEIRAYYTLMTAHKYFEEYMAFFDENKLLRLEGNTEERIVGFTDKSMPLSDLVERINDDVANE